MKRFAPIVVAAVLLLSGCALLDPYTVNAGPAEVEVPAPEPTPTVGGERGPIVDSGPRQHATGEAVEKPDGTLLYTVEEGDITGVICDRFDRYPWQANVVNDGVAVEGRSSCYASILVGDTIVLDDRAGTPSEIRREITEH